MKQHNEGVDKKGHILPKIIDCVKFCGAFELTLHDESFCAFVHSSYVGFGNLSIHLKSSVKCRTIFRRGMQHAILIY